MIPGKYNMVCPQGSTFSQQLTYSIDDEVVDLTGYSARMQVREKHASTTKILDITTQNGGISISGPQGNILLNINASSTSELKPKEYVYDLEIVSSSNFVTRILEGKFIVTPEVTR